MRERILTKYFPRLSAEYRKPPQKIVIFVLQSGNRMKKFKVQLVSIETRETKEVIVPANDWMAAIETAQAENPGMFGVSAEAEED